MDVYTCKIVGWSMDKNMREQLVIDALESAIWSESLSDGTILHTEYNT